MLSILTGRWRPGKLAAKPGRGASQTGALGALHGKATTDQPASDGAKNWQATGSNH